MLLNNIVTAVVIFCCLYGITIVNKYICRHSVWLVQPRGLNIFVRFLVTLVGGCLAGWIFVTLLAIRLILKLAGF